MTRSSAPRPSDGWRRLHPLSPLLRGGLVVIVIAGIVIANFRDRFFEFLYADRGSAASGGDLIDLYEYLVERGLLLLVAAGMLGILLLVVLLAWISWRFNTFRISDEAVEERSGVVFRKHRRAPLERIQSVNLQRPLLARIFGLTKIEIMTAGQGGKVDLAYLGHRDAKTVREQILREVRISHAGDAPEPVGEAPERSVDGMAQRASESAAFGAADAGAAAPAGPPAGVDQIAVDYTGRPYGYMPDKFSNRVHDFADFDIDPQAAAEQRLLRVPVGRLLGSIVLGWEGVIAVLLALLAAVSFMRGAVELFLREDPGFAAFWGVAVVSAVPLVLVMLGVMLSKFNKGFNFTLSRSGDAARTGAGLTSTLTETIPFGRIHAITAEQPLLWRPFGWWKVRITTAGHSAAQAGQNSAQNVVLPVGREADVLRVIDTLLPGVGEDVDKITSLRDGLVGRGSGYLRAGRGAAWVLLFGRRRAGLRIVIDETELSGSTLRVRRGALTRAFSIMPIVRAQSVQLRRPMMHRLLGLASVNADTVLGPVNMKMRGIELAAARNAFDELSAAVLRVQGADSQDRAAARNAAGQPKPAAGGGRHGAVGDPAAGISGSPAAGFPGEPPTGASPGGRA